ncbi:hypothetical protein [Ralstonia phage RP13]|nr:hypothetical protein [Ralstonia phage RP13]
MAIANPYETKVINVVNATKKRIDERNNELDSLKQKRSDILDAIEHLEASVKVLQNSQSPQVAIDAIVNTIRNKQKDEKCVVETMEATEQLRDRAMNELRYLQQHICPHLDTEYDESHSHRGEDYRKCKLCGNIF